MRYINLIDKLTEHDKNVINAYINKFGKQESIKNLFSIWINLKTLPYFSSTVDENLYVYLKNVHSKKKYYFLYNWNGLKFKL